MNHRRLATFTVAVVTAWALPVVAPVAAGGQPWVEDGRVAFSLPDLNGEQVDSSDPRFAGKVLLIDLWATWCPPCISEIPTFIELQDRFAKDDLVVVAIAFETEEQPDERRERLAGFVEENEINYLVLDGGPPEAFESALPTLRNVRGFPVEILVDRAGQVAVARNGYGFKKRWARKLVREVEALLADEDPS